MRAAGYRSSAVELIGIVPAFVFLVLTIGPPAVAEVTSSFDGGLEGWDIFGDNAGSWDGAQGNPPGSLSVNDEAVGDTNLAVAPGKFLGDWSGLGPSATLSYDVWFENKSDPEDLLVGDFTFKLTGPGGTAVTGLGTRPPENTWHTFSVSLDPGEWSVESGTFDAILEDVTRLELWAEWVFGLEEVWIDNVILSGSIVEEVDGCASDPFDDGSLAGWTGENVSGLTVATTGGCGGGYLQVTDQGSVSGVVHAGPAVLGDWRPFDGAGTFSFDLRVDDRNGPASNQPVRVDLEGPGGHAWFEWPFSMVSPAENAWTHFEVPIGPDVWTVGSGTWEDLLPEVNRVTFVAGYIDGSEVVGIDNVSRHLPGCPPSFGPPVIEVAGILPTRVWAIEGAAAVEAASDGSLFVGVRGQGADDGVYHLDGPSAGQRLGAFSNPADVERVGSSLFVSQDFGGEIFELELTGTKTLIQDGGYVEGDADPYGMTITPGGFDGPLVNPGDLLVNDRGNNGPDVTIVLDPSVPSSAQILVPDPGDVDWWDPANCDTAGTVYSIDEIGPHPLVEIFPDGSWSPVALTPAVSGPRTVECDQGGILWMATATELHRVDPVAGTSELVASGFVDVGHASLDIFGDLLRLSDGDKILELEISGSPPGSGPVTTGDLPSDGDAADPVSTFTGELFESFAPDLHLGGSLPVAFARYYASGLDAKGASGRLGTNWRHSYEWELTRGATSLVFVSPQGRTIPFLLTFGSWELDAGIETPFRVLEDGADVLFADPRSGLVRRFDANGRMISVADGNGNALTLTYSGSDLTEVSDGLGRVLTFGYSGGLLATVSDGMRTVTFGHTGTDLASVTDLRGKTTTYAYDPGGLMTSWTLPRGNSPYSQTWDVESRVESQTDAEANTTTLAYDPGAGTTTITDPLSNFRVHTHTATGDLVAVQDETGDVYTLEYDETGHRDAVNDRLGDTTTSTWHAPSGRVASVTQADGATTLFTYAPRYSQGFFFWNVSRIDYPDGTFDTFTWSPEGNLLSRTDRGGFQWSFTYNGQGLPLTATNPKTGATTFTYDPDGTLASRTDPASNTTTYAYDALRRLQTITHPDLTTTTFTWDDADNPLTVTDERGSTTTFTWDDNGNLATITDALTNVTTFAYDGLDRLVGITDPLSHAAGRTYDELGRLETATDRTGRTTTYGYDVRSRLAGVTDPATQTWSFAFDDEAIPTAITDPLGHATSFASDSLGRITGATSPLGLTSGVALDEMGRVTAVTNPAGETTSLTYDDRGLATLIDEEGLTLGLGRDELGLVTTMTDGNGEDWLRGRDAQGRLVSRTDPLSRQETVTYDDRNRPDVVTFPGALGTLTFTYDDAGNPIQLAYSDGTTLGYTWDALNRLTGADGLSLGYDAAGRLVESNGLTMTRDDAGRLATLTLAPGKTLTYAYDARGLLQSITDWTAAVTSFGYDATGGLTSITRPNGVTTTYTWDDDDRLVGITEGALSSIALTRDAAGRTTKADRAVPSPADAASVANAAFTHDAASQISSAGYTYDAMGHLTADPDRTYDWNLASRLEGYTEGANTVTFAYDALGMRISRTEGGLTRTHAWNYAFGLPSVSVERQGGADLRYYVHTPGGALLYSVEAADDTRRDYHFDETGNTLFLTDGAGAVVASYAHGPYGELLAETGAVENGFTWQGRWGVVREEAGDLYQLRARWLASSTRRFLSDDPVSPTQAREGSPYQYALGNPRGFFDPLGLTPIRFGPSLRGEPRPFGSARPPAWELIRGDRPEVKHWLEDNPESSPHFSRLLERQRLERKDVLGPFGRYEDDHGDMLYMLLGIHHSAIYQWDWGERDEEFEESEPEEGVGMVSGFQTIHPVPEGTNRATSPEFGRHQPNPFLDAFFAAFGEGEAAINILVPTKPDEFPSSGSWTPICSPDSDRESVDKSIVPELIGVVVIC